MKRHFSIFFIALFVTILAMPTSIFAKATHQSYCDVMSDDDDCEIFSASEEAMEDVSSGATRTEMAMILRDIPDLPLNTIGFEYEQDSSVIMSDDLMEMLADMREMSADDAEELMNNPVAAIELYQDMLDGMSMAVDMKLKLSDDVAMLANMAVEQELGVPLPETITFSMIIDDGLLYADLESISEFIPEMGGMLQGWVGFEIAPLLELAKEELANQPTANQMQFDTMGMTSSINMNPAGPLVAQIGSFDLSNQFIQFLNVERDEDGTVNGENTAFFRTTFDFDAFFASPIFRQLFLQIMAEQGEMDIEDLTEDEIDEMIATVQIMGPVILQELVLDVVEGVSLESDYLLSREFLMEWDMTSVLQMAATTGEINLPAGAEPFFGLEVNTYTEQFNEVDDIEAPEGAFVLPIEMLLMMADQ